MHIRHITKIRDGENYGLYSLLPLSCIKEDMPSIVFLIIFIRHLNVEHLVVIRCGFENQMPKRNVLKKIGVCD